MSKQRSFWKSKGFIAGVVIGLCIPIGSLSFADSIDVTFMPIHFTVNGVDKTPPNNTYNNNGTSVPASFIYDNTTYIPIHFASDLLGTPVRWDGSTNTIYLGQNSSVKYLSDMTPFYIDNVFQIIHNNSSANKTGYVSYSPTLSLSGRTYKNGISIRYDANVNVNSNSSSNIIKRLAYNLNGQYKNLSFTYGFDDHTSNVNTTDQAKREILLYGDGHLIWRGDLSPGDLPKADTVSLAGVSNLEIQILGIGLTTYSTVDIVNPILTD